MTRLLPLIGLILLAEQAAAQQGYWNLPVELNDRTARVSFEVDSTWHLVSGTTRQITGRVWLDKPDDYSSVRADIALPVAGFDTENAMRDKRMREVMAAVEFPEVHFYLNRIDGLCRPQDLQLHSRCQAQANGDLTIHGVSRNISFPISVEAEAEGYKVSGRAGLKWPDFGVVDPSILVAKLSPSVSVSFECLLPDHKGVN